MELVRHDAGLCMALGLYSLCGLPTASAAARGISGLLSNGVLAAARQLGQVTGAQITDSTSSAPGHSTAPGLAVGTVVGVLFGVALVAGVVGTCLFLRWRRPDIEQPATTTRGIPLQAAQLSAPVMLVDPPRSMAAPSPSNGTRSTGHSGQVAMKTAHSGGMADLYPQMPPMGAMLHSNPSAQPPHPAPTALPRGLNPSSSALPPAGRKGPAGPSSGELYRHHTGDIGFAPHSTPQLVGLGAPMTLSSSTTTSGNSVVQLQPPPPQSQEKLGDKAQDKPLEKGSRAPDGSRIISHRELQRITGLPAGDPFLRHVAPAYKWCTQPIEKMVPVEEGVNAATAAAKVILKQWLVPGTAPGPAPVQLSSQDVQDQIELLASGLIDRGGTAVVYRCRWPRRFGAHYMLAAKVMQSAGAGCDSSRELSSFRHEADVLTRCSHRNIVRLYGYCLEPPNVCLIMELLPSSLKARLYGSGWQKAPTFARNEQRQLGVVGPGGVLLPAARQESLPAHKGAPMTMREVLLLSRDIAEGLAHLHAKVKTSSDPQPPPDEDEEEEEDPQAALARVIHRDLKPANILVNSKGVAKISDFGLAREHRNSTGLDTTNPHMGTLRYMAPELISSVATAKLTSKVDIYSLAILMWEMVARKVPWHEINDLQVPLMVYSGKRPATPGFVPPEPGSDNLDLTKFGPQTVAEMELCLKSLLDQIPSADSAPAFHTFPAFSTIIHACWQPHPRSRPSAATVFKQLQLLVEAAGISRPSAKPAGQAGGPSAG